MPGERYPPPRYFTEHCLKADCYSMPPQVRGSAAAFLACVLGLRPLRLFHSGHTAQRERESPQMTPLPV